MQGSPSRSLRNDGDGPATVAKHWGVEDSSGNEAGGSGRCRQPGDGGCVPRSDGGSISRSVDDRIPCRDDDRISCRDGDRISCRNGDRITPAPGFSCRVPKPAKHRAIPPNQERHGEGTIPARAVNTPCGVRMTTWQVS
ncbi:unnamed protein product [Arctogadus glacialis]